MSMPIVGTLFCERSGLRRRIFYNPKFYKYLFECAVWTGGVLRVRDVATRDVGQDFISYFSDVLCRWSACLRRAARSRTPVKGFFFPEPDR